MSETMKQEAERYGIPYEKDGRVLVWHDEFDKGAIDRTKWCFDRSMNGGDRIYDNSEKCIRVEDGKLHMITDASGDAEKPFILPEGFGTFDTMNFKYGYLEMRGCIPFKHAAWPSFWMQSATPFSKADYMAEIDIFEAFSSANRIESTLHKWGHGKHTSLNCEEKGIPCRYRFDDCANLNNEYHTYGFSWNEKEVGFYVDGQQYACFPISEADDFDTEVLPGMQGFHDFAYVIFNNEFFSEKGGWIVHGWSADPAKDMPIHYYIDWVRLYQDPAKEEIRLMDEITAANAAKAAEKKA